MIHKFKAWLPGIEKMTYAHTLDELINWNTKPEDNGTAIWLQWTGLTDRKGEELYAGHLCREGHTLYEIVWVDRLAKFGAKVIKSESVLCRGCTFRLQDYIKDGTLECKFEIVGTVYENSDLLK